MQILGNIETLVNLKESEIKRTNLEIALYANKVIIRLGH